MAPPGTSSPVPLRRAAAVCALLLAALAGGCGGGDSGPKPQMAPPSSDEPVDEAAIELEGYEILGENPKWVPITPLFEDYARRPVEGIANPMRTNLVTFVKKPEIEAPPGGPIPVAAGGADAGPTGEPGAATEEDPLRTQPLDRYQLIILVTGVPQPKAVVLDALGNRYELMRGSAIGSEGGRVTAILQYKMLVSVPGKPRPVEVSIAPPLSDLHGAGEEASAEL